MTRVTVGRSARLSLLCVGTLVLAGLGACGGSDGTRAAPRSWASTFCQSFGNYDRAVGDLSNRFNGIVQSIGANDLASRKAALVEYLSGSIARSDEFVHALDGAGEPAVPDGGDLSGSIVEGFRDLRTTLAHAARDAKHLSESDAVAFNNTVSQISALIRIGSTRSREAIFRARTRYDTRELDRAFDRVPACQSIG